MLCDVKYCIDQCLCLNHAIKCNNSHIFYSTVLYNQLGNFVFVDMSFTKNIQLALNVLKNTLIFISKHSSIPKPYRCNPFGPKIKLQILDLSFNKIMVLKRFNFNCLPKLMQLILKYNHISFLKGLTLHGNSELVLLDLNQNNIEYIHKCAFCGLNKLKFLTILENKIHFVDHGSFGRTTVSFVLTDASQMCCMSRDSVSVCSAKPVWPASCNVLLFDRGLKEASRLIIPPIILVNFLSILKSGLAWHESKISKHYDTFTILINIDDIIFCSYLSIIVMKDAQMDRKYVEIDHLWRSGILCHVAAFLFLFSVFLSPLFLLLVSYSRYKAVKDPLERPFRRFSRKFFVVYVPFTIAVLVFTLILTRRIVERITYLSTPLCVLLGNTDNSRVQKITTFSTSVYLLLILFSIVFLYFKLVAEIKKSPPLLKESKQSHRDKTVITHLIVAEITNAIRWLPTALFCLVSLFISPFPVLLLYWITLFVLPINSLLNPILFNLSEIKSVIQVLLDFCQKSLK